MHNIVLSDIVSLQELVVTLQLIAAMSLGMLLGAERSLAGKTAGMRTHALVCMAATLFVGLSLLFINTHENTAGMDPFRVVSGVVTGIGFIGAGLILFRDSTLRGLTTAAGLWITAAIGVAIGLEFYIIAVASTLLTLFVFRALWHIEQVLVDNWDANDPVVVEEKNNHYSRPD